MRPVLLALFLALLPAAASRAAEAPPPPTLAVLPLEAGAGAESAAEVLTARLAARLGEAPGLRVLTQGDVRAVADAERQRQLTGASGCAEPTCAGALGGLTGARYVVSGRVDRLGEAYAATAALLDTLEGRVLARPTADARSSGGLGDAGDALADALLVALTQEAGGAALAFVPTTRVGLRLNNSFLARLRALNPGADVEVGYQFHPEWAAFVQVGFTVVRTGADGEAAREGRVNVVPGVLGARHYHRVAHALQPYWGLGLGLQLSFGQFGIFQETGTLPTVLGFGGLEYRAGKRWAFQLEAGTNLAQTVLGLSDDVQDDGVNLDLSAGVLVRF